MMTLHPEIQRKAQEEVDRVVGKNRLPTFADRENLPYVEAVINEVLRLNPVAPLGKIQSVTRYYISTNTHRTTSLRYTSSSFARRHLQRLLYPEGHSHYSKYLVCCVVHTLFDLCHLISLIIYRALLRDPETYPDPTAFNPDRYLGPDPNRNPREFVFGFGRR